MRCSIYGLGFGVLLAAHGSTARYLRPNVVVVVLGRQRHDEFEDGVSVEALAHEYDAVPHLAVGGWWSVVGELAVVELPPIQPPPTLQQGCGGRVEVAWVIAHPQVVERGHHQHATGGILLEMFVLDGQLVVLKEQSKGGGGDGDQLRPAP